MLYWMKCMVTDKYGNKKRLGWSEYSMDVFEAISDQASKNRPYEHKKMADF